MHDPFSYNLLRTLYDDSKKSIEIPDHNVTIHHEAFNSMNDDVLPGRTNYYCGRHDVSFGESYVSDNENIPGHPSLDAPDCSFECNRRFWYPIFKPSRSAKADGLILLLHGLNEKSWDKYLPWALTLAESTNKAVVLFPIAFHMNRAPAAWSDPREMKSISEKRKRQFTAIAHSSFVNAAISTRLHRTPQRFFWSGLQTYHDLIQLMHQIRRDEHPHIHANATADLFGYSIGAFLTELVLMNDPDGLFSESRLFMLCGGPTLDRMYPVSRYILDSAASVTIYSFFMEHLDNEMKRDERLGHYFSELHPSGLYFRSMLSNPRLKRMREERMKDLSPRIRAVALVKDDVIPPAEVLNTLNGDYRNIPVKVDVMDFAHDYTHVDPFPNHAQTARSVQNSFSKIFNLASTHLS
ncbi:hypothetical protein HUU42_08745 [bacterium]|nr:hypothetical protein [bacterium]